MGVYRNISRLERRAEKNLGLKQDATNFFKCGSTPKFTMEQKMEQC